MYYLDCIDLNFIELYKSLNKPNKIIINFQLVENIIIELATTYTIDKCKYFLEFVKINIDNEYRLIIFINKLALTLIKFLNSEYTYLLVRSIELSKETAELVVLYVKNIALFGVWAKNQFRDLQSP